MPLGHGQAATSIAQGRWSDGIETRRSSNGKRSGSSSLKERNVRDHLRQLRARFALLSPRERDVLDRVVVSKAKHDHCR